MEFNVIYEDEQIASQNTFTSPTDTATGKEAWRSVRSEEHNGPPMTKVTNIVNFLFSCCTTIPIDYQHLFVLSIDEVCKWHHTSSTDVRSFVYFIVRGCDH